MTIAAMIAINNPGNWLAVYPALQHAAWNGCTAADLVFPFFIVIMGMALPLSLGRPAATGQAFAMGRRVLTRTVILLCLGLALNVIAAWPHPLAVRVPGVLQRIALTYAGTALLVSCVRPTSQAVAAVGLFIVHWVLLVLVPFGGEPAVVTPAHNLSAWIDQAAFGQHLLRTSGDPEGLLGVVPSIATALIGVFAGRWIQQRANSRSVVGGLVVGGVALLALGLAWSTVWPMNKTLWTGSYALFAAGVVLLVFAGCYLLVDARRDDAGWATPFVWLGVNPLALYFGSELMGHMLDRPIVARANAVLGIKDIVFWGWLSPIVGDLGGALSSLIFALLYVALWIGVAGILYRRRILLRV